MTFFKSLAEDQADSSVTGRGDYYDAVIRGTGWTLINLSEGVSLVPSPIVDCVGCIIGHSREYLF